MSALSEGWGHTTGVYGAYGTNESGYGDPYTVPGAYVLIPADRLVSDDGGVRVTLAGAFAEGTYTVTAGGRACPSGVPGMGRLCVPNSARDRLSFVVPRLPPGDQDVVLEWSGGSTTLVAALRTVRRHRASGVYALRRMLPPARAIGPRTVDDEQLLIGGGEFP